MRKLIVLLAFLSSAVFGQSQCYLVIEKEDLNNIIHSCFRVSNSEPGMTFKEAVLYEKLVHDFGSFDKPSKEYLLFEKKLTTKDPQLMYVFAQTTELAFNYSKSKWAGRNDGVVSSHDMDAGLYSGYDEYIDAVKKKYAHWHKKAALAGSREAKITYINKRLNLYGKIAPKDELELALRFAEELRDSGEPGVSQIISLLHEVLSEYEPPSRGKGMN